MTKLQKIILLAVAIPIGFYTVPMLYFLLVITGLAPDFYDQALLDSFKAWAFGGFPWVWIICSIASLWLLRLQNIKTVLYFAALPVAVPALYFICVVAYFS